MKKIYLASFLSFMMLAATLSPAFAAQPDNHGFDEFGNNKTASNFVGTCTSWYLGKLGGTQADAEAYCGIYSNDKLKMTWNEEWNRGNAEGWTDPDGYKGAWTDNLWNGKVKGGSGEVWHYRFRWIGACTDGETLSTGGYCIWGQFEVIMDHGTYEDSEHMVHLWNAHAVPSGYNGY